MSTVTPKWKLRRLAARGIRIVRRRAPQMPAVSAFLATLVPDAEAYIAGYDRTMRYQANWKKEMDEGRGATASLLKLIRAWMPLLRRDLPGFDASTFGDRPDVSDDVIEDGQRLASLVDEFRDERGLPVPYRTVLLELLGPALRMAVKERGEAEAADLQYQQHLAEVRRLAALLQKDLVALRQTLAVVVGRSDKDYLKLQVGYAATPDEDDDPDGPTPRQSMVAAAEKEGDDLQSGVGSS